MGKKVHPYVFRIGEVNNWRSRWFDLKHYQAVLEEDYRIREFLFNKLRKLGLADIEIERSTAQLRIIIKTSRPGLIIGRGGSGIEALKKEVENLYKKVRANKKEKTKMEIKLEIEEVFKPETNARIVGQQIADQIEKRIPFRRALKQALAKVSQNKDVKGVKIMVSGRLDGAEMARTEWLSEGKIPLQTIRANIDYAHVNAYCRYGVIGIKVWIYKGEVFDNKK